MAYDTFAFGEKAGQLTPDSINSLKLAISGLNKEPFGDVHFLAHSRYADTTV